MTAYFMAHKQRPRNGAGSHNLQPNRLGGRRAQRARVRTERRGALARENRSSSESRPEHVWPDPEISPQDAHDGQPGSEHRLRIRRPGGPPLATPVTPEKANAILASLERIEAKAETEQGPEADPKSKAKPKTKAKAETEPKTKPAAKTKTKRAPAAPRRKLRAYVWAMLAGALVAVLAGGTIGVVDVAGRHHSAAAAAGGAPKGAAAPAGTPGADPNPTSTPTTGAGSAMAAPDAPSAPAASVQPTAAAPNEVGAWPLAANPLASFGAAPGVASHVTFAAGAAVFTGAANSDITTPAPMLQTGPGASFTISAWVDLTAMPTSADKTATAVSQGAGVDSAFYLQYFGPSNRWAFARLDTDTALSKAARTTSLAAAQLNVWTHLVGVYTASTGAVLLYVNSVVQGSTTDPTPFASSSGLEFGGARYNNAASDGFTGDIKDVSVFSQALSPQEVAALG